MHIVESDFCIGFLFGAILEKIGIELCSQNTFPDECLHKMFDSITETFKSSEKQQMLNLVKTCIQSAEKDFFRLSRDIRYSPSSTIFGRN